MASTRRRTRGRARLAVALASLAGTALVVPLGPSGALPAAAPLDGAAGVGDSYFPQDGNGGIDVLSYRIRQRWQPARKRLAGTTVVTLRTTADLRSFHLDFLLPVSAVSVNGASARFSRPTPHEVRIVPAHPVARGRTIRVRVRYAGHPLRVRYTSDSGMAMRRGTLIAVNQPHIAPFWFPANDHPTDRATMDVSTTVPRRLQVIGNGHLVARTLRGRFATWRWRSREPMATYLAYFVAGPLELTRTTDRSGRETWYAMSTRLSAGERRTADRVVRRTPAITRWLERELRRDYPWRTNGAVVVPDLGFALETQGRPVYSSWVDEATVVHELAHQWFGDQVTLNRWQDIWLNEGIASYLEWLHREQHGGATVHRTLLAAWRSYPADDDFWAVAPGAPGAGKIFDAAVYHRGAMVMAALRHRLGSKTLRTVLTTWLERRAGTSARISDFITVAEEVSGADLDDFFAAWLYAPSRPARTVANGLR